MNSQKAKERSILEALLKSLLALDGFAPDSIAEDERPDFILTVGDQKIGVEITLSTYEESVRALKLQASKFRSQWMDMTNFGGSFTTTHERATCEQHGLQRAVTTLETGRNHSIGLEAKNRGSARFKAAKA